MSDDMDTEGFDATQLRPGAFVPIGKGWTQETNREPGAYTDNACNAICIRGIDAPTIIAFLDERHRHGTQDLRHALWSKFGDSVCKADGTPTVEAKGTGMVADEAIVEGKLAQMAALPDVHVILLTVRPTSTLHAFVRLR